MPKTSLVAFDVALGGKGRKADWLETSSLKKASFARKLASLAARPCWLQFASPKRTFPVKAMNNALFYCQI